MCRLDRYECYYKDCYNVWVKGWFHKWSQDADGDNVGIVEGQADGCLREELIHNVRFQAPEGD